MTNTDNVQTEVNYFERPSYIEELKLLPNEVATPNCPVLTEGSGSIYKIGSTVLTKSGNIRVLRAALGMNQIDFWALFGLSQSCGSRLENGRPISDVIKTCIALYLRHAHKKPYNSTNSFEALVLKRLEPLQAAVKLGASREDLLKRSSLPFKLSQAEYWSCFGLSPSFGSRIERNERSIGTSLKATMLAVATEASLIRTVKPKNS
jgi:hypothetical protein